MHTFTVTNHRIAFDFKTEQVQLLYDNCNGLRICQKDCKTVAFPLPFIHRPFLIAF